MTEKYYKEVVPTPHEGFYQKGRKIKNNTRKKPRVIITFDSRAKILPGIRGTKKSKNLDSRLNFRHDGGR